MRYAKWVFAVLTILAGQALAQRPTPPASHTYFSTHPRPFEEARLATAQAASQRPKPRAAANTTPPEIVALARALKNDPDLIYQYVHDNIQFTPMWGYLKGPVGTLLDGTGDAFDQSALMVALLNQAALSNPSISNAGFLAGTISLTSAQTQSWLGMDANPNSIAGLLGSSGIPGQTDNLGNITEMGHVWVTVTIDGTAYVFDPAFKSENWSTGIVSNLSNIMGYSQAGFLADSGGTLNNTSTQIQGVNRTALRNDLNAFSNNLLTYVRQSLPFGGLSDLIGGATIIPTPFVNGVTVRQTSNPNETEPPTAWGATIDPDYEATLSVKVGNSATATFFAPDIYGHRLSILFNVSLNPTLYLDGAPQTVDLTSYPLGSVVGVVETPSLPFIGVESPATQYIPAFSNVQGGGYAITIGWGQVGRGMVEKLRALLTQYINAGDASNSEPVAGESLTKLGYEWLAETAAQQQISDQLLGTTTLVYFSGGITGEQVGETITSPFVDLPLAYTLTPARLNGNVGPTANTTAAYLDSSSVSSAFESAVLEQSQSGVAGFTAASTVKLLDIALQSSDTIFDINNDNSAASRADYNQTIRPQLSTTYQAFDLQYLDYYVNQGYRVIAPLHGEITVGKWEGIAFKALSPSLGYAEVIEGGLASKQEGKTFGGSGGTNDTWQVLSFNEEYLNRPPSDEFVGGNRSPGGRDPMVAEPIDAHKGSFAYKATDLTAGAIHFPYGLSFERSYDSNAQGTFGPLGFGWTHNFAISTSIGSDGFAGMGHASLLGAVSSVVALYVSSDLMKGQAEQGSPNLKQFVVEAAVNKWFTDRLTGNVVYFNEGWDSQEFTVLTDGTYAPQPGFTGILDAPSGTFRVRSKDGSTINFNAAGQIASRTNSGGATVTFTYSNGNLTNVANAVTGRQLTLTYTGSTIASVTDGFRTVSYTYTNNEVTTFTDALLQNTTYSYDTSGQFDTAGHLTQIYYPSNPANAFVSTYYDALGKAYQQANGLGELTQTYFAGMRSEVDDALGNRHVWYFDSLGDSNAEILDFGPAPHLNITTLSTYDKQRNLLTRMLPEGNASVFTYDTDFNQLTVTENPKPGSNTPGRTKAYTYVTPVAGFPNFEKLHTATDWNGNLTAYSYDGSGNLLTIVQPTVNKPGAANAAPTQSFTYTAIGLALTSQDAEGRVTRYQYDDTHADQVTSTIMDSGRLNLTTRFGYDSYGDVTSATDANGNTTTGTYDALRRRLTTAAPIAGISTSYSYFPDGTVKSVTRNAATPEVTQYTYTLTDQVSVVTDPLGNTVTTTYDADDRKQTVTTQVTANQNRQRTYVYDALSRLSQIRDTTAGSPGTPLETHSYSPNSNETGFTDANGHQMSYLYDGLDRRIQTTYPDNSTEKFTYDPNGSLLQMTARSGQTITYTYDALNRLASKTGVGETGGAVTMGYDYSGRMLQALDGTSATPSQIAYDSAGRAINFTDQQGRNTQVQYDAVGNRTRLQWPAGTNGGDSYFVTYNYDALNRMTEIDANGSAVAPLAKYQWDVLSRLTLLTHGDGTTDAYAQYDAGDNLLALTETFTGGSSVTFQHGWFKNHQRQSTSVGNSAFQSVPTTGTLNYSSDVDNAYTAVNATNLAYDGNHNLTYDGFNTLSYDVENRLVQAQSQLSGTSQYFYDPLGRRKQKSVGGVITQFILAGNDEIGDYSGAGGGTAQVLTVRGAGGSPVASVTVSSGVVAYYHHDVLGSTVALTQAGTSGPAETFAYSEFGVPAGGSGAPYLYAGYRYDSETGLDYVQARYYSPQLGRFLQGDPIGTMGGRNLYAYVDNDPINWIDPSGTASDFPHTTANLPDSFRLSAEENFRRKEVEVAAAGALIVVVVVAVAPELVAAQRVASAAKTFLGTWQYTPFGTGLGEIRIVATPALLSAGWHKFIDFLPDPPVQTRQWSEQSATLLNVTPGPGPNSGAPWVP